MKKSCPGHQETLCTLESIRSIKQFCSGVLGLLRRCSARKSRTCSQKIPTPSPSTNLVPLKTFNGTHLMQDGYEKTHNLTSRDLQALAKVSSISACRRDRQRSGLSQTKSRLHIREGEREICKWQNWRQGDPDLVSVRDQTMTVGVFPPVTKARMFVSGILGRDKLQKQRAAMDQLKHIGGVMTTSDEGYNIRGGLKDVKTESHKILATSQPAWHC